MINHADLYIVASDTRWEDCCFEGSRFVYRRTISALVSDAKAVQQDQINIRVNLRRNENFIADLFALVGQLSLRFASSLDQSKFSMIDTSLLQIKDVKWATSGYLDVDIIDVDQSKNIATCIIRFEPALVFEVPFELYKFALNGDVQHLPPSELYLQNKSYNLFSPEIFHAQVEIHDYNAVQPEKIRYDKIKILEDATSSKFYYRLT